MEQIERIQEMEKRLDASAKAIRDMKKALKAYTDVYPQYRELSEYYTSDDWMQDYTDDEAGRLPRDLKRGVLSEDLVFDLLNENRRMLIDMLDLVTKALETNGF